MRSYVLIPFAFTLALLLVLSRPILHPTAGDAKNWEPGSELMALLAKGLDTQSFDRASAATWKELITDLIEEKAIWT
jgi:hypothetical protein